MEMDILGNTSAEESRPLETRKQGLYILGTAKTLKGTV